MDRFPPEAAIFLSAELLILVVRSRDITVCLKHNTQRTALEQKQVENGLGRSILLEIVLFVPVSAGLMLMISPIFSAFKSRVGTEFAFYALLGMASYGFPFAAIRQVVTRIALKAIQEFSNIVKESAETNLPDQEDQAGESETP